jgi:hypothetical protein
VFSPKATKRILSNHHFPISVIVILRTGGILLLVSYLLDNVTIVLIGTVSVQKAQAQL